MLIERSLTNEGWRWSVRLAPSEPSHRGALVGEWHLSVVGAYTPSLIPWLERGVREGRSPEDLLAKVWEKHDAHCAILFLHTHQDLMVVGVDPYAIAKVYVYNEGDRWLLSTRLADILRAAPDAARELEPHACAHFLWQGYTPASHTFYKRVSKIPPSTILTVESGQERRDCYLDVRRDAAVESKDYLNKVREVWENSLENLLGSFDRHHVALSGGIDSSLLLASLLRMGLSHDACVAKTCISLGGDDGRVVLNPHDREFAGRVAGHYGVKHEEVFYRWSDKSVLGDFLSTIENLETEAGLGSLMFKSLARSSSSHGTGVYSAQNADSIFSFALIGKPVLKARPPFVAGLGGWAARANLFGELDRKRSAEAAIIRVVLGAYLRRRYHVRLRDRTPVHRLLGMTFDSQKWPVHLNEQKSDFLEDREGLAEWFEENYIALPKLLSLFERKPHGAFIWLFLQDYMQGRDNRATVWPASVTGAPIFLPFASLGILQLTADLIPDFRFRWYGKYPVMWMARHRYELPDYIINRCDPSLPELDRLLLETFFANREVYDYLESFFPEQARERFEGIVEADCLEQLVSQFRGRRFGEANLSLLLSMTWFLSVEQAARVRAPAVAVNSSNG
jgi:hypothetical protein